MVMQFWGQIVQSKCGLLLKSDQLSDLYENWMQVYKSICTYFGFYQKRNPTKIPVWLFLARNLYSQKYNNLKWITFLETLNYTVGSG